MSQMHRWAVSGAGMDDGVERTILIYASDEDNARREAARQRFAVSGVVWDGAVGQPTIPTATMIEPKPERSALGLTSRTQAWCVAIVGLVLAPLVIGLPLLIWGVVADVQLAGWDRKHGSK